MTRSIILIRIGANWNIYVQNTFKMNATQMCIRSIDLIQFISFGLLFFFFGFVDVTVLVMWQLDIFFMFYFLIRKEIRTLHLNRSNFNRIRIQRVRIVLHSTCDHIRFDCSVYVHKWSVVSVMSTVALWFNG